MHSSKIARLSPCFLSDLRSFELQSVRVAKKQKSDFDLPAMAGFFGELYSRYGGKNRAVFEKKVLALSKIIQAADDLMDEDLPPRERLLRLEVLLLERQADESARNRFGELLALFKHEQRVKNRAVSLRTLLSVLKEKGVDFYLYSDLLDSELGVRLHPFFERYVLADQILDEFADLGEDLRNKSVNLFCDTRKPAPLRVAVSRAFRSPRWKALSAVAMRKLGEAELLVPAGDEHLTYCARGEAASLALLAKHSAELSSIGNPALLERLLLFLTKPYPWSRITLRKALAA